MPVQGTLAQPPLRSSAGWPRTAPPAWRRKLAKHLASSVPSMPCAVRRSSMHRHSLEHYG
eukprot:3912049-Amphidinium_carterae.1